MSLFEKFGATAAILTVLTLFGLVAYGTYDYIRFVRPVAIRMNETIMTGKDEKGQNLNLNRIDVLDITAVAVLKTKKDNQ